MSASIAVNFANLLQNKFASQRKVLAVSQRLFALRILSQYHSTLPLCNTPFFFPPADKKSSAATPAVAAESQQEQQPDETQGPRKIPRHKRKQPEDESLLLPEEAARRRRQKELREIALKLRSHGKEYNHKKYRHQSMSELSNGSVVLDGVSFDSNFKLFIYLFIYLQIYIRCLFREMEVIENC